MRKKLKRVLVVGLGVFFILLGLVGLVLPILQGWLFLAIGILLLSVYSPKLRAWVDRNTAKYPKLNIVVEKANSWVVRVVGAPEE